MILSKGKRLRDAWMARHLVKKFRSLRETPRFGNDVELEFPKKIHVGKGVQFQSGCLVSANRDGSVILEDESMVCRYAIVQAFGGTIRIGTRSAIGDFCNLYGFSGGLDIGNDVLIASGCRIVPNSHSVEMSDLPISSLSMTSKGIIIGDGVWMGANVVVLDGVTIGKGAVIGAGAVVTHDIPSFSIAAGVPAKFLRERPGSK